MGIWRWGRRALGVLIVSVAGCGGGDSTGVSSPPAAVARIEIRPSALVLTTAGATKQLTAHTFDANGHEVLAAVAWASTSPAKLSVATDGKVTAVSADGSAQITATAGGVTSPPVLVVATTLPAGVMALTDAQIVGDPVETTPDAAPSFDNTYSVTLTGVAAPAVGTLLINTEGKAVAGRVVAVDTSVTPMKVTLGLVSIRELLPNLNLNEVIDLGNAPVTISPDIAARYDVKRTGDLFEFTPKPGAFTQTISSGRARALAAAPVGTSTLPPFNDCTLNLTGGVGSGSVVPLSLTQAPVFSIKIKPSLDLVFSAANGLERFVVKAAPVAKLELALQVDAAFEGSVECTSELFDYVIPVGGPLALFVAGQVPVGVGLEVAGKVTLASLVMSLKDETSAQLDIGIECPPGSDCGFVRSLTATNTFTPTFTAPNLGNLRVEPSLSGFGYAEVAIGNPFLKSLRFKTLKAKAGGKVTGSFAPIDSQIIDTSYKSDYKVSLEAKAGVGVSLADALKLLGLSKLNVLELKISADIAKSPAGMAAGAVVADKSSFVTADTVNFVVHLDPSTLDFFPGVGPYNVDKVRLVRRTGGTSTVVSTIAASNGQADFNFSFVSPDSGQAGEFTAFVVTKLLPLDLFSLEIGTATGPFEITTSSLPNAIVNAAYSASLAASGGAAPLSWAVTGLPAGMHVDAASGIISGTPTAAGAFTVTIAATSANGLSAQKNLVLSVSVAALSVYEGSLTESIDETPFTQCGSVCQTITATGRDDYTGLRFVLQANGSFVATGSLATSSHSDTVSTDGCHDTITETGTGTVTGYTGTRTSPKGSIVATGSVTRIVTSAACRGNPASSSSSTSTRTFMTSSDFLQPVFSGGVLVQLVWNGGFTDATNTTFKSLGEVHLMP